MLQNIFLFTKCALRHFRKVYDTFRMFKHYSNTSLISYRRKVKIEYTCAKDSVKMDSFLSYIFSILFEFLVSGFPQKGMQFRILFKLLSRYKNCEKKV